MQNNSESKQARGTKGVKFADDPKHLQRHDSTIGTKSTTGDDGGPLGSSMETFKTASSHTPKIKQRDLTYKDPAQRTAFLAPEHGTLAKPNYEDILRRVSIVVAQHIDKCEQRFKKANKDTYETGLFHTSQMNKFSEENFISPQYMYHFVRAPICRLGFLYGIREVENEYEIPTVDEVHSFLNVLFTKAQLSAECSIVCLIYVERLMEMANVPLLKTTWRPCVMCGMLLASKVWQDLSAWNIEFSQIYPQYSLQSINRLERIFCQEVKWDLCISSSAYAKYYFALRSLTEKHDFRQKNLTILTKAPGAQLVAERSEGMKEGLLSSVLSKSL